MNHQLPNNDDTMFEPVKHEIMKAVLKPDG